MKSLVIRAINDPDEDLVRTYIQAVILLYLPWPAGSQHCLGIVAM